MPYVCDIDFKTAVKALVCGIGVSTLVSTFGCDISLNPVVTSPDCDTPSPAPCVALSECSETSPFGCETIQMLGDCESEPGFLNIFQAFQMPLVKVSGCSGCEFVLPRTAWGDGEVSGSYPAEELTWTLALSDLTTSLETWQLAMSYDCLQAAEISRQICARACGGDPGCENACEAVYQTEIEACGNAVSAVELPSAECLGSGYSVTVTLVNPYNYPDGPNYEPGEQICTDNPIYTDFRYRTRTVTITDSFGNQMQCAVRFYDINC
jgi:hypothetical protein